MAIQKHQKGQLLPGQLIRKQFYEQAVRLTGFPSSKCREILVSAFGTTFEEEKIQEYLALLKEHATEERQIAALNHKRQALRNRIRPVPAPDSCPITGCGGVREADRIWQWVCSIGGYHHYMAYAGAMLAHCTPDEMLMKLDNLMAQSLERRATELEELKKGIEKSYELEAWYVTRQEVG